MSRYGFSACSWGSSMLQPIDSAPASRAPRLAASISPGAAAGDDRVAGSPEAGAELARERVGGVLGGRARGAEHGHRRPDVRQSASKPRANSAAMSRTRPASAARTSGGSSPSHSSSSSSSVGVLGAARRLAHGASVARLAATAADRRAGPPAPVRTLSWAMAEARTASEIPYTVRRSARARRVRVNVHAAHAASRSCCRRARPSVPRRPRSASCARGSSGAWRRRADVLARSPRARGRVPYLGARCELVPQEGRSACHRRGERLLVPAGDAAPGARALLPAGGPR